VTPADKVNELNEAELPAVDVVSQTTILSWWVPFEIGVATRADRRIATFRRDSAPLPAFLKIWPVLDFNREFDRFAIRYFQDLAHGQKSYRFTETMTKSISTSDQFHARLKADLGQA
jgi:hypothetical protein